MTRFQVVAAMIIIIYGVPLPMMLWIAVTRDPTAWIAVVWGSAACWVASFIWKGPPR